MTKWLPVVRYESSYEVSDDGHVRSLDRVVRARLGERLLRSQELVTTPRITGGYPKVTLWRRSQSEECSVHVLMLEAFIGPRPEGMFGLHDDDVRTNNTLPNLYWGTPSQNNHDQVKNGRHHLAAKKRCKRDHDEWRIRPTGFRYCGACDREYQRRRKQERAGRL